MGSFYEWVLVELCTNFLWLVLITFFVFLFGRVEVIVATVLSKNACLQYGIFTMVLQKKKYMQCFCEHLNCRLVFNCSVAMVSSTTKQGWHKWYGNIEWNFCTSEEIQIIRLCRRKHIWTDISHMRIDTFNWVNLIPWILKFFVYIAKIMLL